ncbi:MAG: hypothetical protein ACJ8AW_49810, partial [Rhodopila sp.]
GEGIAVADQATGLRHHGLGVADLGPRGLLVELDQKYADSDAGGERQAPQSDQPASERGQGTRLFLVASEKS